MLHLFILFPLLIILAGAIFQLTRKRPENISFRYFRNFIAIWSICTIGVGLAETLSGQSKIVFTTLAFVLPFLYVSAAYLLRVPFALYQKEGGLSKFLAALTIVLGIFYGLSVLVMVRELAPSTGPLQGLFTVMSGKVAVLDMPLVLVLHMATMLVIFVSVGLFFLVEALKSKETQNRVRSLFIGLGLIITGPAEWYHVMGLHAANRDFILIFGFLLVVAGLLYPTLRSSSAGNTPTEKVV